MVNHPSLSQMSGYTPGYGTVPGWTSGLPWTYYLLDGGSRQHAVYEGRYLMTDVSSECDTGAVLYWVPAEYLMHGTGDVPYLSLLPNGDKRYRIQDNLGSTRVVFDGSGALYQWTSYEPFGKTVPGSPETDRLSWIGKEKDSESDLGDFGARKYDEETGRFLSIDPMWEKYRGFTPYNYSANNPLIYNDPSGKDYNVVVDESSGTVTISMTILAENEDGKKSAESGKEHWESQNGKFEYVTTNADGTEKVYQVKFEVNVVTELPENSNAIGAINEYGVYDKNNGDFFNTTTDPKGTRPGVTTYDNRDPNSRHQVAIKEEWKTSKLTSAHEIGHLFGLGHRNSGLMADNIDAPVMNGSVTSGLVNSILGNARRQASENGALIHTNGNIPNGSVKEKP